MLVIGVYMLAASAVPPARAQTLTTLYSFKGEPDGQGPYSTLVRDAAGNLYGTTSAGGNAKDGGTVFEVDVTSKETLLHAFTGFPSDGESPTQGWPEIPQATDMAPLTRAAPAAWTTDAAPSIVWMPPARSLCCTASPEEQMARSLEED